MKPLGLAVVGASRRWVAGFAILLALMFCVSVAQAKEYEAEQQRIELLFPKVTEISEPEGEYQVRTLADGVGTIYGYAFQSINVTDMPAYSGKPINMQILLDPKGVIVDAYMLEHHEPIVLIGIPEQKVHDFNANYSGIHVDQRVVVGRSSDKSAVTVDAVTGATVTVMVINEIVMRTAHTVAVDLGLVEAGATARPKPALVREDVFQPTSWTELVGNGAIRRMHLTRGQVDDAFKGTEAEGVDVAAAEQRDETFIDLYATHLNPPTIGRNLLGERQYSELMANLKPGEHAFAVLANGEYSFKGSGYVRGGIFDRVQLRQFGDTISFRDLDFIRLSDVYAEGMPDFFEMAIFIAREQYRFDPGSAWNLELLVRRQIGPIESIFTSFEMPYLLPDAYFERPPLTAQELAAIEEANRPLWVNIWY